MPAQPFHSAEFVTSAVSLGKCPEASLPEVCLAGRSNVGKSSLINRITNRRKLAKTSNTPGKTQQMNYYRIDDRLFLVDLPGFGYAKVPERERKKWAAAIREYLEGRETLRLVLHLVDSRHPPTKLDEDFFYWMGSEGHPFAVLLTKTDKLTASQLRTSRKRLESVLEEMNIEVPIVECSAETGMGLDTLRALILEFTGLDESP